MVGTDVGALSRRRLIAGLLLVPPAVAGCAFGSSAKAAPDPLIALAESARADAALAAAAAAADPQLAGRVAALRAARTDHAAALDAEVARLDPARASATPAPTAARTAAPTAAVPAGVTLIAVRDAVQASGQAAAAAALTLPAARVGLVASVAACCATYAAVLV